MKTKLIKSLNFIQTSKKFFSGGPYNHMHYRRDTPSSKMTTEEAYFKQKQAKEFGDTPKYSMRHVHPIRQSGPIPPFAGAYTMEDVRIANSNQRVPFDRLSEYMSAEELMRRVPGLTKKEALKIQSIGLNPYQQLDYAYIAVNNGIDLFFEPNHGYVARQVVTK